MIKIFTTKIKKSESGFTLIELLLYVSLTAIMLLLTAIFLATLLDSQYKNEVIAEVEQQGASAMEIITQVIRNAENINSPAAGAATSTLSLDAAGTLADPTVFDLSSGFLRIKEAGGVAVSLNNNRVLVSNLSFLNASRASTPGIIKISFTISYINTTGRAQYDWSKTFNSSATLRQP